MYGPYIMSEENVGHIYRDVKKGRSNLTEVKRSVRHIILTDENIEQVNRKRQNDRRLAINAQKVPQT